MTSSAAFFHLHLHPHLGEHRIWKRRRLKLPRAALFPHLPPSLHLLAPALGFLSGAALFLARPKPPPRGPAPGEVGEWLLVTAPTPFNRFVLLRCPSIRLAEEEVDERLLREGRRFVNLSAGKISTAAREGSGDLAYQRVCVGAEDGGVVSLDWPENLDLGKEHGLDTTVLLVPGTPQGSMDGNVRSLVSDALRCGYFPVVMNPRGCAGSPLTTAR